MSYYSDNLDKDIDRYLQDDMEHRARLPICCGCGDHIAGDYTYLVGDHRYCEDCWEELVDALTEKCRVRTENCMEE